MFGFLICRFDKFVFFRYFRFFFGFALPLTKATLAVLFLYTALSWWNMYMPFVIYINKPELQSLQVVIRSITAKLTTTVSQDTMTTDEMAELERQNLTSVSAAELERHAYSVNDGIGDPDLRNAHVLAAV